MKTLLYAVLLTVGSLIGLAALAGATVFWINLWEFLVPNRELAAVLSVGSMGFIMILPLSYVTIKVYNDKK